VQAGESELKSEISAFSKTGNTKSNEAYGFVKNKPKVSNHFKKAEFTITSNITEYSLAQWSPTFL